MRDVAAMSEEEREVYFEDLEWKKAKRKKHHGLSQADYSPREEQVTVHDFDDDPTDAVRAEARAAAAEARALIRSQFRQRN